MRLNEEERRAYRLEGFVLRRAVFSREELEELRAVAEEVIARVVERARRPGAGPEFHFADGQRAQFSSNTVIQWEWNEGSREVRLVEPFTHLHPRFDRLWTDARLTEPMQDALGAAAVGPYTCRVPPGAAPSLGLCKFCPPPLRSIRCVPSSPVARGLLLARRMKTNGRNRDARARHQKHQIGMAERIARAVARFAASTTAFLLALATVLVWAALGPFFGYSDTWQLVINTGTTIVTFLMVFLIQRTQDKESLAVQIKLNELIAALEGASNRLVNVESLSEEDLGVLRRHYARLAEMAETAHNVGESHSIDEAESRHAAKHGGGRRQGQRS